MNSDIYTFVASILQIAQAHNVTVDGSARYNVPSGTIDASSLSDAPSPNLTSYTEAAIVGADDFNDGSTTITDVFDIIVNITRQATPTCEFPIVRLYLFVLLTLPQSSRNRLESWVRTEDTFSEDRF